MTHKVETAFDRTFSEPPQLAVSDTRTHCEACKEPLAPDVMHKCHGNKHYEPPVVSHTDIAERCPECQTGEGVMVEVSIDNAPAHVVVCKNCRTYLYPIIADKREAIASWNLQALSRKKGCWPVWRAGLPSEDERNNIISQQQSKGGHPDLTGYQGVCPECRGLKGKLLDPETGDIDPCKVCDGKGVIGAEVAP